MPRRLGRWILASLTALAVLAGGIQVLAARRYRSGLDEAWREIAAGRHREARRRLEGLAPPWSGREELDLSLGACLLADGAVADAVAVLKRIDPESPLAARAALYREQAELARGRLAEVEAALVEPLRRPDPLVPELRRRLARLFRVQGRLDEVAGLIEADFDAAPDPVAVLREHAGLDLDPPPTGTIRRVLEQASSDAPDDDRVWLGLARLAIRSGRLDEADRLLEACATRRPDDPAVARARLDLAGAADDPRGAREVLGRMPPGSLDPARALALHAWLATHTGDAAVARRGLERWAEGDPTNPLALERLAEWLSGAGDPERAADLRRRKGELDRARRLYRSVLASADPRSRAAELAQLAEQLGRTFEARGWWTVAARTTPGDSSAATALARLAGARSPAALDPLAGLPPPSDRPNARPAAVVPPRFVEAAETAGLRFEHRSGRTPLRQLPETMSGGLALLDFDGDGWLDVYAVQGGSFPPRGGPTEESGDRLFRNRGDGGFDDATQRAGLAGARGYGHGAAVGDVDNDGDSDLFVTRFGAYALYRNEGDGTFRDVTQEAGLDGERDWPTSAAFADLDGDGDLDLYVAHYLSWDPRNPRICRDPESLAYTYCVPHILEAMPDHLFRNDGGQFVDVTAEAGIVDREGPGLGVVAADLDDDGRVDLFVANDGTANAFYRNRGGLRFEEVGLASGVASNAVGGFQAGMGAACGDLDGDGLADLVVTNFHGESTTLFRNLGRGLFADRTASAGLQAASRDLLGFGVAIADFNDDGRADLATVAGHVNDFRPRVPYAMPAQVLAGTDGGRLVDVTESCGSAWTADRIGRALVCGDLDNDSRVDALILGQDAPLALALNRTPGGRSVTFRLEGDGRASNRDAVGAVLSVTAGGKRQVVRRTGGGSYQSAGDPRLHVGLGDAAEIDLVEVRWPSGRVDRHANLPADAGYLLREGAPSPDRLPGFD